MENEKIIGTTCKENCDKIEPHSNKVIQAIKNAIKKIYKHFSKPVHLMILNGVLITLAIYINFTYQVFCNPTPWAVVLIAICLTNTILYPILEKTKLNPLTSFINGVSFCLFIYCVLFIGWYNFCGLLVLLAGFVGLALYIPHFFVIQLIWRAIFRPKTKTSLYYFLTSIVLCLGIVIYIGQDYKKAIHAVEKCKETNYQELDRNFMTEKILGMHFIYHMEYCPYDGWRPPKHEPILVIGKWLNLRKYDPLNGMSLKKRLELYRKFFPYHQYKFDCACGKYGGAYHNDDLWKEETLK